MSSRVVFAAGDVTISAPRKTVLAVNPTFNKVDVWHQQVESIFSMQSPQLAKTAIAQVEKLFRRRRSKNQHEDRITSHPMLTHNLVTNVNPDDLVRYSPLEERKDGRIVDYHDNTTMPKIILERDTDVFAYNDDAELVTSSIGEVVPGVWRAKRGHVMPVAGYTYLRNYMNLFNIKPIELSFNYWDHFNACRRLKLGDAVTLFVRGFGNRVESARYVSHSETTPPSVIVEQDEELIVIPFDSPRYRVVPSNAVSSALAQVAWPTYKTNYQFTSPAEYVEPTMSWNNHRYYTDAILANRRRGVGSGMDPATRADLRDYFEAQLSQYEEVLPVVLKYKGRSDHTYLYEHMGADIAPSEYFPQITREIAESELEDLDEFLITRLDDSAGMSSSVGHSLAAATSATLIRMGEGDLTFRANASEFKRLLYVSIGVAFKDPPPRYVYTEILKDSLAAFDFLITRQLGSKFRYIANSIEAIERSVTRSGNSSISPEFFGGLRDKVNDLINQRHRSTVQPYFDKESTFLADIAVIDAGLAAIMETPAVRMDARATTSVTAQRKGISSKILSWTIILITATSLMAVLHYKYDATKYDITSLESIPEFQKLTPVHWQKIEADVRTLHTLFKQDVARSASSINDQAMLAAVEKRQTKLREQHAVSVKTELPDLPTFMYDGPVSDPAWSGYDSNRVRYNITSTSHSASLLDARSTLPVLEPTIEPPIVTEGALATVIQLIRRNFSSDSRLVGEILRTVEGVLNGGVDESAASDMADLFTVHLLTRIRETTKQSSNHGLSLPNLEQMTPEGAEIAIGHIMDTHRSTTMWVAHSPYMYRGKRAMQAVDLVVGRLRPAMRNSNPEFAKQVQSRMTLLADIPRVLALDSAIPQFGYDNRLSPAANVNHCIAYCAMCALLYTLPSSIEGDAISQ